MKISQLLNRKSKWCKGSNALDAKGYTVPPASKAAIQWCLAGAAQKCYRGSKIRLALDALKAAAGGQPLISSWNDRVTWPQVRKVILKAKV